MLVWWAAEAECASAIARLELEGALADEMPTGGHLSPAVQARYLALSRWQRGRGLEVARKIAHRSARRQPAAPRRLAKRRLDQLVEAATVDAYGESEQRVGLLTMIQEHLACPFQTEVLGTPVRVGRVDLNDADEIVAVCRRMGRRQMIPVVNLPLPSRRPAGWEWIEAYRHWARGGR